MANRRYLILSACALPLALAAVASCATPVRFENMRARAESAETELKQQIEFTHGAHQDAAMMQTYAIELQQYIRQLEYGMAMQALETARLRRSCDI